jgi:hypothetical protein
MRASPRLSLADALQLCCGLDGVLKKFGRVICGGLEPLVAFAHFFWRSRAASWPALGSVFGLAVFSDALDCCANAAEEFGGSGAASNPAASRVANITLYMTFFPLDGFQARTGTVGLNPTTWFAP